MDETLDTRLEFHEGAVVDDADHLALQDGADGKLVADPFPGVLRELLEAQRHPLLVTIEGEDFHLDLVALVEGVGRLRHLAPRYVGDMEKPVDAAQVDEEAVVGDVLDDPLDDLPLLDRLEELLAVRLALLLHDGTSRQHDIVALAVVLEDVELHGLTDEAVEIPDGPDVHLGAGQKRRDPDVHREAPLHPLGDRALDGLVAVEFLLDAPPGLDPGGLVPRENQTVVLAPPFHEDFDLIAHADSDVSVGIPKFPGGDHPLCLGAHIHHDRVGADLHHPADHDLAGPQLLEALLVEGRKAPFVLFLRRRLILCRPPVLIHRFLFFYLRALIRNHLLQYPPLRFHTTPQRNV